LSLSPLSHHIAAVAIAEALSAGMELVVNDPPPGTTPLDWILETGASYVMGVPTHAMDILGEMRRRGLDKLGKVKTFYMAGAPIPREVVAETARVYIDAFERITGDSFSVSQPETPVLQRIRANLSRYF